MKKITHYLLIGSLAPCLAFAGAARGPASVDAPSPMKMTTAAPEGVATPDRLETRLGALTSVDGVPDEATAQKIYDNLDFQRATQAYLNSIQVASLSGVRTAYLEFGPANKTILCWEDHMDSKALWLTPNTVSIYFACWMELGKEPLVIETPPNMLGLIDNAWFNYVTDFGNAGPDKGKGGTFIIAPPEYDEAAVAKLKADHPTAFVSRSETYGHWILWRGLEVDGSTAPAVNATKEHFKIYPLSQKDNQPAMNFVNMSGVYHNTIHRMDFGLYEEVNKVIQREPTAAGDPEILGQLAAIGIKKGKEFAPDPRMKKILVEAADVAAVTVRTLASRPRGDRWYFFPGKRQWQSCFYGGSHEFLDDGVRALDARCYFFFYATGITPAMTAKMVGKGSQYAVAYTDADENALDGSKTYKVNLPAPIPAKDFWSFTLYDTQTRSMLQTDQQFPGIDGNTPGLEINADGSIDVYVGPEAPEGKESNWLQSVPGKGWQTLFRLYGPLEPWFDKTWMPGDFELVK
jgi:hypothetical protein